MGRYESQGGGSFVDLARLDADQTVLDHVVPAEAEGPGDLPHLLYGSQGIQQLAVNRDRSATLEADLYLACRLRILGRARHLIDVLGRARPRILQNAALDAPAPKVFVDRVG